MGVRQQARVERPEATRQARDFLPVWFLRVGFEHTRAVAPLRHSPSGIATDERVCIIPHLGRRLHDLADSEGGSSGSPVFNQRKELIAAHHAGAARDKLGVRVDRLLEYLSGDLGWFVATGLTPQAPERGARGRRVGERPHGPTTPVLA